jgi:hypothetical protein
MPETCDHILNSCSWYVWRANHYQGGIDAIPGLILFLCNNPTAFSFDPTDCPRHSHPNWPSYYREVYRQQDATNEIRKQKKLPLKTGPLFYHETVEFFFELVLDLDLDQDQIDSDVLLFLFLLSQCFNFMFYLMYRDLTCSVLMSCCLCAGEV